MSICTLQIDRREFVKNGAIAGVAAAYPKVFRAAGKGQAKPNILLVMSDEHNQGVTGCYGMQIFKLPVFFSAPARALGVHGQTILRRTRAACGVSIILDVSDLSRISFAIMQRN